MSEPVIRAQNLGKMYRIYSRPRDKMLEALGLARLVHGDRPYSKEFWALRGVDFTIHKGERVGFIGRNGAGKSTFLKMAAGTLAPTEGSLQVSGNVQALMELGTGFHPEFTGRENIYASLAYNGLSKRQIDRHVDEIIDFAELESFIDHPVKTYSAGMYARLAFTTSTVLNPEILIIDEVLGAGDAYFAGKSLERMRVLTTETGATVLFVSHDVAAVQSLCTRAIWIDRGRVMMDGPTVDVVKAYYRAIQKEEALQRQAKQMGIRKTRDLEALEKAAETQALFHFVCDTDHPRHRHMIRAARLLRHGKTLMELSIGAPMDNLAGAEAAIMDAPGYMDWSPSGKDSKGFHRFYANQSGRYNHAPFYFSVPGPDFPSPAYTIEIDATVDAREPVHLELFWNKQYHRIATLDSSASTQGFALTDLVHAQAPAQEPSAVELPASELPQPEPLQPEASIFELTAPDPHAQVEAPVQPAEPSPAVQDFEVRHRAEPDKDASVVTWERPDPCISKAIFVDAQGEEVAGIEEMEDLIFEMHYSSSKRVANPVFSLSIWRADGSMFCHANAALADLKIEAIEGEGKVVFRFPGFRGTAGEYMIGCSIFHYLDPMNAVEQRPYYDQHDRAYRFKVWKKLDNAMFLGLARIEFEVSHKDKSGAFNQ